MEDKKVLNEHGGVNDNDFGRTFATLEPISSRRAKASESVGNEFHSIAYEEFLNYSSQSRANNRILPVQDNWRETEILNANGLFTESSLKWQENFQEVQPNPVFEYNESSGVNTEMQGSEHGISVDISTVGECIRNAIDCLLGIYPQNNDLISENFDSRSEHSTLHGTHLFEPEAEPSIFQREHLNVIGGMNSKNKFEIPGLKKELINFDSIKSGLQFPQSCVLSTTAKEECKFLSKAENPSFEKIYCEKCFKIFTRKDAFLKHKCVNTTEKSFEYSISQEKDNKPGYKRLNTKEKKVQCDVSEKSFSSTHVLVNHRRMHTGEKPFQCNVCEKSFSQLVNLNVHMRTHTGEKPFQCNVCEKSFSQLVNLNVHMRTHTGEKPFQCNVCVKSFAMLKTLNDHMRTHTGEKPFQCNVCEKSFALLKTLNDHMRTHTGEKPFQCNVCEKSFAKLTTLNAHMRTHTGEKPFQCPPCKRKFSNRSSFKRHMLLHNRQNTS